jgi:uncharacterized protein (DUF1697 family)
MNTFISFLRGINMAGHFPLKMADLSDLYKSLGFKDAETYIQSGNVIFTGLANHTATAISEKIEAAILHKFGYDVPVVIRSANGLESIITANPFISEDNFDPSKMVAILLYEKPTEVQIQKVIDVSYPPDKFTIIGSEIFVYCPNGFGRSKLYTNFFEKKMGVRGTARNWKTITTLYSLAQKRLSQ